MNKKQLSEKELCQQVILPAIERAGWDQAQIKDEVVLTKGRVIVRGKLVTRGEQKRADYVLYYKPGIPLAVVEAKDNHHGLGGGMQQGLAYAEMLDVPFTFSTNGDGFLFRDATGSSKALETELSLDAFPSPDDLWKRYAKHKKITPVTEPIVAQDYWTDGSDKLPRYYQVNAINRVVEAVAKGQDRVLLVMATGTGKTFTAFQIIWRLWKAGVKKRILFLADRNILVDQTKTNDFKPFGGAMTKVTDRKVDKSFEIYLALYQAVTGTEEERDIYKQFSRDFFDLIVVDECHRGSAAEDSAWREILEYFGSATHLGMTATPKETSSVSTKDYFGEATYSYSLRQGIEDGFLAPYKVVRVDLDKDLDGWRPPQGKVDKHGLVIKDRVYNQKDFDRSLVLEKRTELVAKKVTELLKATDRYAKTIVFCQDIDHAERTRIALSNENADLCTLNRKYVMQITGDKPEGKAELYNFTHPEQRYPVVVTTSKLLTTGVDAKTCKVIVIDQTITSVPEFKQIIGRGTRIEEDFGKLYFTILDFRRATELFATPDFDGDPVQIYQPKPGEPVAPPDPPNGEAPPAGTEGEAPTSGPVASPPGGDGDPPVEEGHRTKYVVNDVPVYVVAERVQYYGKGGQLITESLRDYTKRTVREEFATLDQFLKKWTEAERKQAIVTALEQHGIFFEELAAEVGRDYSAFDLVAHIAFGQPPLTRKERAGNVRKRNYFGKYSEKARAVLETLLDTYADQDIGAIEGLDALKVAPLTRHGTPIEILRQFGGKEGYLEALHELERVLYLAS